MQTTEIRAHLTAIIVKGSARGNGVTLTDAEAAEVLDGMIASDEHPAWDTIREGREQMQAVISGYLR